VVALSWAAISTAWRRRIASSGVSLALLSPAYRIFADNIGTNERGGRPSYHLARMTLGGNANVATFLHAMRHRHVLLHSSMGSTISACWHGRGCAGRAGSGEKAGRFIMACHCSAGQTYTLRADGGEGERAWATVTSGEGGGRGGHLCLFHRGGSRGCAAATAGRRMATWCSRG